LDRLKSDSILKDNHTVRIAESLYVTPTEEEAKEYETLKHIDIDVE